MVKDIKEQAVISFVWKFLERAGRQTIRLIIQIVLARLLSPEDFGMLAIMIVFINIAATIVDSGLSTALVQDCDVDRNDYSTVFWMSLALSIVVYAILFFCAPRIATFYSSPSIVNYLRALGIIIIFNSYTGVQQAVAQRELNFKKVFKSTLGAVIISGFVGILLAYSGYGVWSLVFQQLTYSSVEMIAFFLQSRWIPAFYFNISRAKKLFNFGYKLLLSGLLNTMYSSLSDLIIGRKFNTSELGFVSQGAKYPSALGSMLDGSVQPVMLSTISRVQSDKKTVKKVVRRSLKTSTFIVFPMMVLFAVVSEPLICVLLGDKWLPCLPYMRMYCFIMALLPIHSTNLQALNGMGRSDLFLKLEIIKKFYGIIIICIATFIVGNIEAIVGSYIVTGVISTFVNAYPNKKVINYSYLEQIRDVLPSFSLSLVAGFFVLPFLKLSVPNLILIFLVSVIYIVSYFLLAHVFKMDEASYIKYTIKSIVSSKISKDVNHNR